jgi:hypothetical protein
VQLLLNAPESPRDSSIFSVSSQSGHAAVMFSSADDEVLDVRPSTSNATRGVIVVRVGTLNQDGEAVQLSTFTLLVPRRGSSSAAEVKPPVPMPR